MYRIYIYHVLIINKMGSRWRSQHSRSNYINTGRKVVIESGSLYELSTELKRFYWFSSLMVINV